MQTAARAKSNDSRAFTLVEMLVVMGIISLLLVAVIPAVNSLSKSNGRKAAIGNLLGAIEQTRMEAIKSGQATYVVFPVFSGGTALATLDRYHYKSYAIFEDDPAKPGTPKQLTPWRTLPTGVSFRASQASTRAVPDLANSAALTPAETFSFTPDTKATVSYYCIKFNADGEVEAPVPTNGPVVLLSVFEGRVEGSNEIPTSKPMVTDSISIAPLTGRAEQL